MDTITTTLSQFLSMLKQSGFAGYLLYVVLSMFGWGARMIFGVDDDMSAVKAFLMLALIGVPVGLFAGIIVQDLTITTMAPGLPYIASYVGGTISINIMQYLWGLKIKELVKRG